MSEDIISVEQTREFIRGAKQRIRQTIQREMDVLNQMGYYVDVYVRSINVDTIGSALPEQIADVQLDVKL